MKLFSNTSSRELAKSISTKLDIPLGNLEIVRFGDTEVKPVVKEDVRGEDCVIITSTNAPVNDSYIELFLMVDALRRSSSKSITVVMPYMGYARQNQQHMLGEPVSAQVMVKFIEAVGVDEVITVDLHEEQVGGFFSIPLTHLSCYPILAKHVAQMLTHNTQQPTTLDKIVVVSPDQGGIERTRVFRDELANLFSRHFRKGGNPVSQDIAIVEKKRNLTMTHKTKIMEVSGADVEGAIAIIPDDVIVSGGTIANASNAVAEKGAKKVILCATHADFIDGTVEKLQKEDIYKVIVCDTIPIKKSFMFDRLEVVSIADMIAEEIVRL